MAGIEPRGDDWTANVPTDGKLVATVWWCGDEYCDCTQAQIQHWVRNQNDTRFVPGTTLWWGTFHTDGTGWVDDLSSTTELNREARRLRKKHNELFHRIEWPWDRKAAG